MVRLKLAAAAAAAGLVALQPYSAYTQDASPRPQVQAQKEAGPKKRPAQEAPGQTAGESLAQLNESLAELLARPAPRLELAELAGMKPGSKPAVLSLEQAYSLAMIRMLNPAGRPAAGAADRFDPKALDAEVKRAGGQDFDRFRREFLANRVRDPAPGFFAALRHRQGVASARDQVALTEVLRRLFEELAHSEGSGVSQLQLAQVDHHLLLSRQNLEIELSNYRSAVDELKVALGLSARAPIVLDERILDPFIKVFRTIGIWQRHTRGQVGTLSSLHDRLPKLEEITIGGRSLSRVTLGAIPQRDFLQACTEAAGKQLAILNDERAGPGARNALELWIRKAARGLILTRTNYEVECKGLELAVREVDQRFEQLVNPPAKGTGALAQAVNATVQISGVLQDESRLYRGRTELVAQWLQFKQQTLELYHELGILPYDNWDAFYRSFLPNSGGDLKAP